MLYSGTNSKIIFQNTFLRKDIIMRILTIGDIVGVKTIEYLKNNLWKTRSYINADFVVANAENATNIKGLSSADAKTLLDCGIDFITTGNHVFGKRDLYDFLDSSDSIIRPANYPSSTPGNGYAIKNVNGWKILCINIMGNIFMSDNLSCPFDTIERILSRENGNYDIALLDIHAEATSEKLALAMHFDGRIHIIFGTHTHVPTADEKILTFGTGYITDLGMSGPENSILGVSPDEVIRKLKTQMPQYYTVPEGKISVHGAIFDIDAFSKRVTSVERIVF